MRQKMLKCDSETCSETRAHLREWVAANNQSSRKEIERGQKPDARTLCEKSHRFDKLLYEEVERSMQDAAVQEKLFMYIA